MRDLLQAGEFARLCGTTKETLRHYERVGLLAPFATQDNGYRCYAPSQVLDYMTISSLKEAGYALSEIRDIVRDPDAPRLKEVVAEKIAEIDAKRKALDKAKRVLEDICLRIDGAEAWREGQDARVWRTKELDEAFYLETPLPLHGEDEHAAFKAVAEHEAYCRRCGVGFGVEWPKTYRLARDAYERGSYEEGLHLCTRVDERVDSSRLVSRPAGLYLQHVGHLPLSGLEAPASADCGESDAANPVFQLFEVLRAYATEHDMRTEGDVFAEEMTQSRRADGSFLAVQVSVRVSASPAYP